MIITVKSTIELSNFHDKNAEQLKKIIRDSGITSTIEEDVIFLSCTFDNANRFLESLALHISKHAMISHEDIIIDIENEYNGKSKILIRGNRVFVQEYELTPMPLKEIKG